MCPGSPALLWKRLPAALAGTGLSQEGEGVDAGAVSVTPVHPKTVRTDQSQRHRPDVGRHVARIEEGPSAHLFNAAGAGAGQAQHPGGEKALVPLVIPLDEDAVVPAVDGVGYLHTSSEQ